MQPDKGRIINITDTLLENIEIIGNIHENPELLTADAGEESSEDPLGVRRIDL